jgi:hypothetical protein
VKVFECENGAVAGNIFDFEIEGVFERTLVGENAREVVKALDRT